MKWRRSGHRPQHWQPEGRALDRAAPPPLFVPARANSARTAALVSIAVAVLAIAGLVASFAAGPFHPAAIGRSVRAALWLLPLLVALHLGQLGIAAWAWRSLLAAPRPAVRTLYRLRIIREGIDSLLPVAQIGGEIVGARLLTRLGVPAPRAAASVVVDVTIELLTQLAFLGCGLAALSALAPASHLGAWPKAAAGLAILAAGLLLAQRFGSLRALELLAQGVARRWPAVATIDGLNDAARMLYRNIPALAACTGLHWLAWILGSIETWAVLHGIGIAVSPSAAFTIEALGMAARSAGFAIPAALGAQEGGFVLAAAALGIAAGPALALSLVKRLREVLVGGIGLGLWRWAAPP